MQFKHWLATLLGVASLLIVFALAKNNLNTPTDVVSIKPAAVTAHPVHSWDELFGEDSDLPPAIQEMLKDDFKVTDANLPALSSALEVCEKNNYKPEAARLLLKKAAFTSSQNDWLSAGEATYKAALSVNDTLIRDFLMAESIVALNKVLENNPDQVSAQLFTGLALSDKKETMMQGVPYLLKVVKQDPENLAANYTLALLAIESGQFDKALIRFEKLISLQPSNMEYVYQAGNAAMLNGDKEKAKAYFTQCLGMTEDKSLKEEINTILTNLK